MTRDKYEIAMLVQELLETEMESQRRQLSIDKIRSGGRVGTMYQDEVRINPSEFKVVSETKNEHGDTIIEWEATSYIRSSRILSGLTTVQRSGTLLIKSNGRAELV
jgi:hypothetical protein